MVDVQEVGVEVRVECVMGRTAQDRLGGKSRTIFPKRVHGGKRH